MDHQRPFSLAGATVTFLGQAIVLPESLNPALRMGLSVLGAFAVGVVVPIAQRALRDAIDARLKVREIEAERDELRAELRRLRSGEVLLAPPGQAAAWPVQPPTPPTG